MQHGYMTGRAEVLKEEVRKMLKAANQIKNILDLIITLQRLGLDNHYENEINELLSFVYNSDYDDKDLYLVSLRFYLLRKHGYYVSSGNQHIYCLSSYFDIHASSDDYNYPFGVTSIKDKLGFVINRSAAIMH